MSHRAVAQQVPLVLVMLILGCSLSCSSGDETTPEVEEPGTSECSDDSMCGPEERCEAGECAPIEDQPSTTDPTEADLIALLDESE